MNHRNAHLSASLWAPAVLATLLSAASSADAAVEDPCELYDESAFKVDADAIIEASIPEHDPNRDETIRLINGEIAEARELKKNWAEIEQDFLSECSELRAGQRLLADIDQALATVEGTTDCARLRQHLIVLEQVLRLPRRTYESSWLDMLDAMVGQWQQATAAPNGCARGSLRQARREELRSWGSWFRRELAAMRSNDAQLETLRHQYQSQARKRFTLDALLAHQRGLSAALEKDASDQLADKAVGKLPWLIVILGVFCLSIMVMVHRFREPVQLEWVRSGQVIQFMTVTIIIIVILALGLSGNLQKESLGTLLGTIGGYVLSNGLTRRRSESADGGAGAVKTADPSGKSAPPP